MTVLKVAAALLLLLGVLYALMYAGLLPRPRTRASAASLTGGSDTGSGRDTGTAGAEPAAGQIFGPQPADTSGRPRALTLAWVQGKYLGTTVAVSRQERIAASGLGAQSRANMVVDDSIVRWEREGLGEVRIAGSRLLGASLKRDLAGTLVGQAHVVLVSWRAGNAINGKDADRYVTGFLPRTRADSAALVSAVQRLMKIAALYDNEPATHNAKTTDDAHPKPDGTP